MLGFDCLLYALLAAWLICVLRLINICDPHIYFHMISAAAVTQTLGVSAGDWISIQSQCFFHACASCSSACVRHARAPGFTRRPLSISTASRQSSGVLRASEGLRLSVVSVIWKETWFSSHRFVPLNKYAWLDESASASCLQPFGSSRLVVRRRP